MIWHAPVSASLYMQINMCGRVMTRTRSAANCSIDDVVGDREQLVWYVQTKRLGRLRVDNQLELGRLNDRQVGGFGTIKNATHIDTHLERRIASERRIADQTTGGHELRPFVHDRHLVAGRQRHQSVSANLEEQIRAHQQRTCPALDEGRKGQIKFTVVARVQNNDVLPYGAGSILDLFYLHFANLAARVHEEGDHARLGN